MSLFYKITNNVIHAELSQKEISSANNMLRKNCFFIFLLIINLIPSLFAGNKVKLDSLLAKENQFISDTTGIKNFITIAQKIKSRNYDSAIMYIYKAIRLSNKINNQQFYFQTQFEKCVIIKSTGNYKQLSDTLQFIYNNPQLSNFKSLYISFCQELGVNFRRLNNFDKSIKYLLEALKTSLSINYKPGIYNSYNSLANTYSRIGEIKNSKPDLLRALDNYNNALKYLDTSNINAKGMLFNNQGVTYFNIGVLTKDSIATLKSIDYYKLSLECRKKLNDSSGIANVYNNIGSAFHNLYLVHNELRYLNESTANFEKGIEIGTLKKLPELYTFQINYAGNLSSLAENTHNKDIALKAIKCFKESRNFSIASGDNYSEMLACDGIAKTYFTFNMNDSAVIYYQKYISLKDTLLNEKNKQVAEEMALKYESDLKDTENKNLKDQAGLREEVISRKSATIKYMIVGSVLLLVLIIVVLRSRQKINKAKQLTEKQKLLIEVKQKEILDSINYAKRIQQTLLPSEKTIQKSINQFKK